MTTNMTGINPMYQNFYGNGYSSVDQFFNCGNYNMGASIYNPYMTNSCMCNPYMTNGFDQQAMWNQNLSYLEGQNTYNQSASAIYNQNYSQQLEVSNQATVIRNMIASGNPEDAIAEIDELTYSIMQQPQYQGISEQGARALALQQAGGLQNLIAASENCDGAFKTGFLNSIDIFNLFGDHEMSQEEFIARLQGTEAPNESQTQEKVGSIVGGAAGLGAVAAVAACIPGVNIGVGIIAGVAAVGGLLGGLFGGK